MASLPRYRFGPFLLSPAQRRLQREGRDVSLIPRYFDLLLLLLQQRHRLVDRHEILDRVWADVVVSDGALSQAIRTLRRTLGDDSRQPVFLRTAARRGYQFIHPDVLEEDDRSGLPPGSTSGEAGGRDAGPADVSRFSEELEDLLGEERPDLPGPAPGPVPHGSGAAMTLVRLLWFRGRGAAHLAGLRWGSAAAGGALAGSLAGLMQALCFQVMTRGGMPAQLVLVDAAMGALIGGVGAAGVGAGLAAAEALSRMHRTAALLLGGTLAGGVTGWVAVTIGSPTLETIFGRSLAGVGGMPEGLALGAAAALGYAVATSSLREGGMAAPRGAARWRVALVTGSFTAVGAGLLMLAGGRMAGASLDLIAARIPGAGLPLQPLADLLGETSPGRGTYLVQALYEGLLFGTGLGYGLTRRPR